MATHHDDVAVVLAGCDNTGRSGRPRRCGSTIRDPAGTPRSAAGRSASTRWSTWCTARRRSSTWSFAGLTALGGLTFEQLGVNKKAGLSKPQHAELQELATMLEARVGAVLVALEAKACMMAHGKADNDHAKPPGEN